MMMLSDQFCSFIIVSFRNKLMEKMERDNTYHEDDGENDPLFSLSIGQIGELSAPELVEFIVAHDPNITTKNQI